MGAECSVMMTSRLLVLLEVSLRRCTSGVPPERVRWSRQAGGPGRAAAVAGAAVSLSICLSSEMSWREELEEKWETEVGEDKQVRSEGQVSRSSW